MTLASEFGCIMSSEQTTTGFLFRIFWFYESNEDDELLEDEWEDIGEDGFSIWAKSAYDGILA